MGEELSQMVSHVYTAKGTSREVEKQPHCQSLA